MINPDIRSRALLLAIIPAMVIAILLTAQSSIRSLKELDEGLHERGRIIAIQLASACEYGTISGNHQFLQKLVQETIDHEHNIRSVLITDHQGHTLAVSGRPILLKTVARAGDSTAPSEWDTESDIMFSAPIFRSVVELDDFPSLSESAEAARSLPSNVVGQVYVVLDKADLARVKHDLINDNLLIALTGLIISGLIGWRIGRSITRPILAMADAVSKVADGKLDQQVAETSEGELRVLEQGFNTMAARLKLAHDNMQESIDLATQQLRYQAQHDALTGLLNRREFEQRLHLALDAAQKHGSQHILCYMDLDQFKIVNDTCGHSAGDELLRQLSLLLSRRVREKDTLARLGGDEFGLLLENCTLEDARRIAEELLEMVHEFRYVHQNKIFSVGVCIGMATITRETRSTEDAMSAADSACFAAKDAGRNQIHVFDVTNRELAQHHGEMEWVSRINRALEQDRFLLYAQPIRALHDGEDEVCHAEILLRKLGEDGQIVMPMAFIPAAERFQLMNTIDRWVIRNAFAAYRLLSGRDNDAPRCIFTINLSGTSLGDKTLLNYIVEQFALHDVPPQGFGFEITETAAITNLANTMELMHALKSLGCHFLLDDFGSGMSSFGYLKNLPVDFIKIDGNFVKDLNSNPVDRAMVQSIRDIAEAMRIQTIAEYVENAAAVETLVTIGVNYGQGYHLGKPLPIEQMIGQLNKR